MIRNTNRNQYIVPGVSRDVSKKVKRMKRLYQCEGSHRFPRITKLIFKMVLLGRSAYLPKGLGGKQNSLMSGAVQVGQSLFSFQDLCPKFHFSELPSELHPTQPKTPHALSHKVTMNFKIPEMKTPNK